MDALNKKAPAGLAHQAGAGIQPEEILMTEDLKLVGFVIQKYFKSTWAAMSREEKEDFFQEGCIGLIRAAKKYNPEKTAFSTFAASCIINTLRHYVRKTNTKMRTGYCISILDLGDYELNLLEMVPSSQATEGPVITNILLKEAIKSLDAREKKIIYDYYFANKPQNQIACMLNRSQSQTCRIIHKALAKMRTSLGGDA